MSAKLEAKKQLVAKIQDEFKDAKSIVFVNYKGINVAQDTALRKKLRAEDVTYKVYKNRLLTRALDNLGITDYDPSQFEGSTAVAFSKSDEIAPARILAETIKELKKMEIKFGVVNGDILDKSQIETLAKIPSKPILIAMLLGLLKGPMGALVRGLDAIAKKDQS